MKIRSHLWAIHAIMSDQPVGRGSSKLFRHSGWSGSWRVDGTAVAPHEYRRARLRVAVVGTGSFPGEPSPDRLRTVNHEIMDLYHDELRDEIFGGLPFEVICTERAIVMEMRLGLDTAAEGGRLVGNFNKITYWILFAMYLIAHQRRYSTATLNDALPTHGSAVDLRDLALQINLIDVSLGTLPPEPVDIEEDIPDDMTSLCCAM